MMTLLVPFWAWIILGVILGWKMRGYFGKKFSFLGFIRNPLKGKKKKPPSSQSRDNVNDDDDDDDDGDAEGIIGKVTRKLAKPIEKWMGDDKKGGKK